MVHISLPDILLFKKKKERKKKMKSASFSGFVFWGCLIAEELFETREE